jgi:hypothetical protein
MERMSHQMRHLMDAAGPASWREAAAAAEGFYLVGRQEAPVERGEGKKKEARGLGLHLY